MKLQIITIVSVLGLVIFSCTSKKGATSTTVDTLLPGDTHLTAIQAKFPDATAATLKQGHDLYIGACTNCHGKKNMYKQTEAEWLDDVNRMAPKAKITDTERDALWKYVLAMRLVKGTPAN